MYAENLTLDTFFKNRFSAAPYFVFFGDLNERAHEKTTTDILEQQLFVHKIIMLSILYIPDVRFKITSTSLKIILKILSDC